jgi:hypothetical protein
MSEVIFKTLMSLFIGSVLLSLTACASDHGYDGYDGQYSRSSHHRNDGSNKTWQERAFERGTNGTRFITGDPASDILAGGL